VWDSHRVGMGDHLFRPGGLLGAIPTKTLVLPHQFLVSCRLSLRQFFHVARTVLASIDFFLKILLLVWMLSIFKREFMAWSHLLCISCSVWVFVGSLPHVMTLSQRIFQIMYMDSETRILNRRLRPLSGVPFAFLKLERQHPRRAP